MDGCKEAVYWMLNGNAACKNQARDICSEFELGPKGEALPSDSDATVLKDVETVTAEEEKR